MLYSKTVKKTLCIGISVCLGILMLSGCGENWEEVKETTDSSSKSSAEQNEFTTEYTATDTATIEIKDYGTIKVALDAKNAPITVENFKNLANSGFYNGLTLHRIMAGFMMQGGDPQGTGMGGSDKTIKGEFRNNGVNNPLSHTRGAISMARNSQSMDSASSQFFICHSDSTFLDGSYACFGYVTEGIEVVDSICADAKPVDDNGTIPKENQPIITKITIG
ncbi:MAG: peptidylprolyl isomerase [Clostridia bacterium]|nr:peptidylprolyl isomerase [Clostridia bacterium]